VTRRSPIAKPRLHAIILTHNRAQTLSRCVANAMATMDSTDVLTILDASSVAGARANLEVLGVAARESTTQLHHICADNAHGIVDQITLGSEPSWRSRTGPRDIAPLRNLSLLIAVDINAQTTVLVDDDIHGFDLGATHRTLNSLARESVGVIAGAHIAGINEQDAITRLSDALCHLVTGRHDDPVSAEELFRVPARPSALPHNCGWVSAGYMAFRLPTERLFAFPPGYNEDWLWCILHDMCGGVSILRLAQSVVHEPPDLRRSTNSDFLFEFNGDLVFENLARLRHTTSCDPSAALRQLAQRRVDPDTLPQTHAQSLLAAAHELAAQRPCRGLRTLETHGLRVLEEMCQSGHLAMDGQAVLKRWSRDAGAKQKSFAASLASSRVRAAVHSALQEGQL
jgi:hypothetical protein